MHNYGLIHDEIQPEDYVLGDAQLKGVELNPSADWTEFLPVWEAQQRKGVETVSCATFATLNALETILFKKFGILANKSDKYNAIRSKTTQQGNSPHRVIESIRKEAGTIPEAVLPFGNPNSWDEYHDVNQITEEMAKMGADWLNEYSVTHDWVFSGGTGEQKCELIMEALKYSPVGVSVLAWPTPDENGMYTKNDAAIDNHWTLAFRGKVGEYIEVWDTYENRIKKIKWGYNFNMAKRYAIDKKPEKVDNWFIDILRNLLEFFKDIFYGKK